MSSWVISPSSPPQTWWISLYSHLTEKEMEGCQECRHQGVQLVSEYRVGQALGARAEGLVSHLFKSWAGLGPVVSLRLRPGLAIIISDPGDCWSCFPGLFTVTFSALDSLPQNGQQELHLTELGLCY